MLSVLPLVSLVAIVSPARAETPFAMTDIFPPAPLTSAQAAALLVPERIGAPARTYDQTTVTPGFARSEESAIEGVIAGSLAPPSDALRRYTRQVLSLMRQGTAHNRVEWFVAEHVGLATVPEVMGTFFVGDLDPARVGKLVSGFVPKDAELRSVAVAVERDEARGGWAGIITGLYGAAEFEPFPRVHAPGGVAVLPGTLLAGDASYAIYVSYPGTEVREFPLKGKGEFDVEVPLPVKAGVYRVAMNKQKKRQLPDSAFFFTLYVGEEPPTRFPEVPNAGALATAPGAGIEQSFLAEVNAARADYQLPPLAWVDRAAELRETLGALPPSDRKVARWRYVRQIAEKDPLPGRAHGAWGPAFTDGQDAAEAAWTAIEHPITRSTFLGTTSTLLTAGALTRADAAGVMVLSFVVEPGSDPLASRAAAFDELRRLHGGASATATTGASASTSADLLQGKLDAIAAEVASGKKSLQGGMAAATKELKALQKLGWISGAMTWSIYAVPPGEAPKLDDLTIPPDARSYAIGAANGDLGSGKGYDYTVLVILAAGGIK